MLTRQQLCCPSRKPRGRARFLPLPLALVQVPDADDQLSRRLVAGLDVDLVARLMPRTSLKLRLNSALVKVKAHQGRDVGLA